MWIISFPCIDLFSYTCRQICNARCVLIFGVGGCCKIVEKGDEGDFYYFFFLSTFSHLVSILWSQDMRLRLVVDETRQSIADTGCWALRHIVPRWRNVYSSSLEKNTRTNIFFSLKYIGCIFRTCILNRDE